MVLHRRQNRPAADAHDTVFFASLLIAPDAIHALLADDTSPGAEAVRGFFRNLEHPPIVVPLTSAAKLAVESIRRCPFGGACRAMALTARSHDLLLEFLASLSAAPARTLPLPNPLLVSQT